MLKELKSYSALHFFFTYCLFLLLFLYLGQILLIDNNVFYNSLSEQLSASKIEGVISFHKKWAWLTYISIPVIYGIKLLLITSCLLAGSLFLDFKMKFEDAFKAALLADVIFIVPMIIRIIWFLFYDTDYIIADIQNFQPLSLVNLFDVKSINSMWLYTLQTISVFEVCYILALGFWISQFSQSSYKKGLALVISSYLPSLLIWMIIVMFVTITINPGI